MTACGLRSQLWNRKSIREVQSWHLTTWRTLRALTLREGQGRQLWGSRANALTQVVLLSWAGFSTASPTGAQQKRLRDLPAVSEFHEKLRRVLLRGPGPPPPSRQRVHHAPGAQVHRQLRRLLLGRPTLQRTELWNEPLPGLPRLLGVRRAPREPCMCMQTTDIAIFSPPANLIC